MSHHTNGTTNGKTNGVNGHDSDSHSFPNSSHFPSFGTDAAHHGSDPDKWDFSPIVPPISLSTTFKQSAPGVYPVRICDWFVFKSHSTYILFKFVSLPHQSYRCYRLWFSSSIVKRDDLGQALIKIFDMNFK